ncbi:chemotaxis protein CheW [Pedosphaera parvula]|uniref:CheW protein n=1 Tax=Pedosphaera parvula (strain Ellin514) TaxID=320771 RepID=B9XNN6_PEDPL|nr:chemotaxis protein CheW [Pedosphaera parvula]EEF58576.1 CheW protein [Pedosphaera parvula Ellin514]
MLFLTFQLGQDRYALEASRVIEVLPLVEMKRFPNAPAGVAGMINYRAQPVPIIDLSELTLGQKAGERMSTRIILIKYPDHEGREHPLGLIAEQATSTIRREASDFIEPGLNLSGTPYLGPVLMEDKSPIQWLYGQHLLTNELRDKLFCASLEESP